MKSRLFFPLVVMVILGSCAPNTKIVQKKEFTPQNPMVVVTTIGMIADVTQRIGGERVQVTALMGPGIDPHLYKAKAGDVNRLDQADLILYSGLHLESKLGEILEQMAKTREVRAITTNIPLEKIMEIQPGVPDPHVWFDVMLWELGAQNILDTLVALDTPGEAYYRGRFAAYSQEMEDTDDYVRTQVAKVPQEKRILITAHDAFNYFGKAYGFEVIGLQGISTVDEAGTKDVSDLAEFIVKNKIPAIFVETSVSPKTIEAVKAAVASRGFLVRLGGTLYSDAMGNPGTPEGTYLGMVKHNIDTIVGALHE